MKSIVKPFKLLTCPYCGSDDISIYSRMSLKYNKSGLSKHKIHCNRCNRTAPEGSDCDEALDNWNDSSWYIKKKRGHDIVRHEVDWLDFGDRKRIELPKIKEKLDPPNIYPAFKAYDIRGTVPEILSPQMARAVGAVLAMTPGTKRIVVGADCRLTSPSLKYALLKGITEYGVDAVDLGLCGTEEIYRATAKSDFAFGVMITGSHNLANENGIKIMKRGAIPLSRNSGLNELEMLVAKHMCGETMPIAKYKGHVTTETEMYRAVYIDELLEIVGADTIKPMRVVFNCGNGCASVVLTDILDRLNLFESVINIKPDGRFPKGVPNPLLPDNRLETSNAVKLHGANLGIAFDGDFDRCFFFDEKGEFVDGYYIVGLLAEAALLRRPFQKIVHDPRVYWNTVDIVKKAGGVPVMSKTGHTFMKEAMRKEKAVYGGEMSAHHYFREFSYCDSGMLPWLFVLKLISERDEPLGRMVAERKRLFPCSGEMNLSADNGEEVIKQITDFYAPNAKHTDFIDGANIEFDEWRFNLRMSNTEPLIRLNIETRESTKLLEEKTKEVLQNIYSLR